MTYDTTHDRFFCLTRALKLSDLARDHLCWEIQTGQHDSVEDAIACMRLFCLRHGKQHTESPIPCLSSWKNTYTQKKSAYTQKKSA
jgi:DNA polymerase III epsilon subunit-like protein